MIDWPASILARLKNKANETGRSYHLCLQLFCQEEFLRRLQISHYSDNFVLKGGLFLYALTEFDSRATVDIDFLIRNIPNTPEKLESVVREIIQCDTGNNFVSFEMKKTTPNINTYSVETTVAEKLDAILSLMSFTSRMKDYYDLYYLANKFDFRGTILTEALSKTFENRDRAFTIEQFDQLMTFVEDDGMNKKWVAFTRKTGLQSEPYATVLQVITRFLRQPYSSVIYHEPYTQNWSAEYGYWA